MTPEPNVPIVNGKPMPILVPGPNDDVPCLDASVFPYRPTQRRKLIKEGVIPQPFRPTERKAFWTPRQVRQFYGMEDV